MGARTGLRNQNNLGENVTLGLETHKRKHFGDLLQWVLMVVPYVNHGAKWGCGEEI